MLAAHPRFVVTALVDAVDGVAGALARTQHVAPRGFNALAEALADTDPDLVVVCTPSGLHVEVARQALAANCHVVIEKPLDVSLVRARQLVQSAHDAARRGQVCSVISQRRSSSRVHLRPGSWAKSLRVSRSHRGGEVRITTIRLDGGEPGNWTAAEH